MCDIKNIGVDEKLLFQLESDIREYDKIFLLMEKGEILDKLAERICNSKIIKDRKKKVLILALKKKSAEMDTAAVYRQITEIQAKQLYKLYSMYEFSDRFQMISRKVTYGGLLHLVDTGILNLEEATEALLH
jgi:uncharacterized protein YegL